MLSISALIKEQKRRLSKRVDLGRGSAAPGTWLDPGAQEHTDLLFGCCFKCHELLIVRFPLPSSQGATAQLPLPLGSPEQSCILF